MHGSIISDITVKSTGPQASKKKQSIGTSYEMKYLTFAKAWATLSVTNW